MILSPLDRLLIHLALYYPDVRLKDVSLHEKAGILHVPTGTINIRSAGYGKESPSLRLWNELHDYFKEYVKVLRTKQGQPTRIEFNGCIYNLDPSKTYRQKEEKRKNGTGKETKV